MWHGRGSACGLCARAKNSCRLNDNAAYAWYALCDNFLAAQVNGPGLLWYSIKANFQLLLATLVVGRRFDWIMRWRPRTTPQKTFYFRMYFAAAFAITAYIYFFFAVGLVAPAQLHNKWKTESELATFIFFSTAADSLKTLNCVRVKIVWLNLPWQRIGCRGPQRPQWSLICGYNNTTADKHTAFCATYFSRHSRVKVEKLYVSSSFAFECGSWFTQNDLITIQTQVVRVKKK